MPRPSKPDAYSRDLFGEPIPDPSAFRKDGALRRIGYADRPGTGPAKQRCGTCVYAQRCVAGGRISHKCELKAAIWNYSTLTDISLRAPACSKWERRPYSNKPT